MEFDTSQRCPISKPRYCLGFLVQEAGLGYSIKSLHTGQDVFIIPDTTELRLNGDASLLFARSRQTLVVYGVPQQ